MGEPAAVAPAPLHAGPAAKALPPNVSAESIAAAKIGVFDLRKTVHATGLRSVMAFLRPFLVGLLKEVLARQFG